MANIAILDIDLDGVDFDAAHAELLTLKLDHVRTRPDADSRLRAIASWANFIDDCARAFQRRLREYETRIDALETAGGDFLPLDGSEPMTGDLDMGGNRIANLAELDMDGNDITDVALLNGIDFDALASGAALSVLGRAANSVGTVDDIVAGTDGHVLRRSGTALGFGLLAAGAFATGPGIVTPAMLDNGTARSVLGRSANSSGARADIAGGGADTVCSDDGTTIAFRTITVAGTSDVIYDLNFAGLASNTLVDGTETIDGRSWTVNGSTDLAVFDLDGSTGLRMQAGTSLGTHASFTSSAQDAPHLYIPLSSLPNWDARYGLIIEIYCPTLVLEQNGEHVFIALWGVAADPQSTSIARVRRTSIINTAGVRNQNIAINASITTGSEALGSGPNVLSMHLTQMGIGSAMFGTWSSDWPIVDSSLAFGSLPANADPFNRGTIRLAIGMGVADDASPTSRVTIERLRIRRAV